MCLSLFFDIFFKGGLFFAKPMREKNYISMMDPFQRKYGKALTAALAVVPLIAEIIWIPGLLISLGTNVQIHSDFTLSLSDSRVSFIVHICAVRMHALCCYRSDHECHLGSVLQRLRVDLCCGGHHLHCSGRSQFSCLHRCHPDITGVS